MPALEGLEIPASEPASETFEEWERQVLGLDPWKQHSDPETVGGAEWLYEIMMA